MRHNCDVACQKLDISLEDDYGDNCQCQNVKKKKKMIRTWYTYER